MVDPEKIAVILRVFPGLSKPDPLGLEDKFALFKLCLDSFKKSVGDKHIRLEVLLDTCPQEYATLIRQLPENFEIYLHEFDRLGNGGSFQKQIEIASKLEDTTPVLFLEDDYYWSELGFDEMTRFYATRQGNFFITPYNHPDYRALPIHKLNLGASSDWLEGLSTTCTFLASAGTIKRLSPLLRMYDSLNDFGMWLCITRKGIWPRLELLSLNKSQRSLQVPRDWGKAFLSFIALSLWRFPSAKLFYPAKSGATHMDANYLGLGISWDFK